MDLKTAEIQTERFISQYIDAFSDMPVNVKFMTGKDHDAYCWTFNNYTLRKPEIHVNYEMIDSVEDLFVYLLHELIHIRTAEFDILLNSLSDELRSCYQNIVERCVAGISETIIKLKPEITNPSVQYLLKERRNVEKSSDSLE